MSDLFATAPLSADEPLSPLLIEQEAQILVRLRRGHHMSCSDPTDPSRHTSYGDAALVIDALTARLEAATRTP